MKFWSKIQGIPISSILRAIKSKFSFNRRKALDTSEKLFGVITVIFIILISISLFVNKFFSDSIFFMSSDFSNQVLVISQMDEEIRDKNIAILEKYGINYLENVDIDDNGVIIMEDGEKTYIVTQNESGLITDVNYYSPED